jgi:hypothetical protein
MKEYGFIPLKELRKLPVPLVLELLDMIETDYRKAKTRTRGKR